MTIATRSQYHTALALIEAKIEKGFANLTKEETEELKTLSTQVAEFEQKEFPMPTAVTIREMLEYYMYTNRMNQSELSRKLEVPNSTISAILSGKKRLNLELVKKLHRELELDGNMLLEAAL